MWSKKKQKHDNKLNFSIRHYGMCVDPKANGVTNKKIKVNETM